MLINSACSSTTETTEMQNLPKLKAPKSRSYWFYSSVFDAHLVVFWKWFHLFGWEDNLVFHEQKIFLRRRQKFVFNFSPLITNNWKKNYLKLYRTVFDLVISYPEEIISSEIKHERTKMFIMTFFTTANNKNHKQDMYKSWPPDIRGFSPRVLIQ